jgi:hypothetical protein
MEALFPTDNSFFILTLDDAPNLDVTAHVVSFEVTEDNGVMTRGSIEIYDPDYIYSKLLPYGKQFVISWGYKNKNINLTQAAILVENPKEIISFGIRRGIRCIGITPSWSLNNAGVVIYKMTFFSFEFFANSHETQLFKGTKRNVIYTALLKGFSIPASNTLIKFKQENDNIGSDMQNESYIKYLQRKAYEWNSIFKIGYNQKNQLSAMFIGHEEIGASSTNIFLNDLHGGVGSNITFEYGIGAKNPNVISASISQNVGESGQGDGVSLVNVGGQTIATRYVVENKTVKALTLSTEKVALFLKDNPERYGEILSQLQKVDDLEATILGQKARYFFDAQDFQTAPQGMGWTVSIEALGNTTFTPLVEVQFGEGFLNTLRPLWAGLSKFWIKRVTHRLSGSGYLCSLEIGDCITVFGGFVKT